MLPRLVRADCKQNHHSLIPRPWLRVWLRAELCGEAGPEAFLYQAGLDLSTGDVALEVMAVGGWMLSDVAGGLLITEAAHLESSLLW